MIKIVYLDAFGLLLNIIGVSILLIKIYSGGVQTLRNDTNVSEQVLKGKMGIGYKISLILIFIGLAFQLAAVMSKKPKSHFRSYAKEAPYLYGVPPAPPFQEIDLVIANNITDGCNGDSDKKIGYIIEVKKVAFDEFDIIIQDESGVRGNYYINASSMGNAQKSWLPSILIPGNKVEMQLQYCGSGGFAYIMSIKSLSRHSVN